GDTPFERSGLPGILARLRSLEEAPEEVDKEHEMGARRHKSRDRHNRVYRDQVLQEDDFGELGVPPDVPFHADEVHRHEDAIDSDKSDPEMDLAQGFIHHAPKHLGEPEEGAREHAKDSRNAHHHVEMRHHKVAGVQRDVYRGLSQEKPAESTGEEERNEADGKK